MYLISCIFWISCRTKKLTGALQCGWNKLLFTCSVRFQERTATTYLRSIRLSDPTGSPNIIQRGLKINGIQWSPNTSPWILGIESIVPVIKFSRAVITEITGVYTAIVMTSRVMMFVLISTKRTKYRYIHSSKRQKRKTPLYWNTLYFLFKNIELFIFPTILLMYKDL